MMERLLQAEARNAELELQLKREKCLCTLGLLFAHVVFFQVPQIESQSL